MPRLTLQKFQEAFSVSGKKFPKQDKREKNELWADT